MGADGVGGRAGAAIDHSIFFFLSGEYGSMCWRRGRHAGGGWGGNVAAVGMGGAGQP